MWCDKQPSAKSTNGVVGRPQQNSLQATPDVERCEDTAETVKTICTSFHAVLACLALWTMIFLVCFFNAMLISCFFNWTGYDYDIPQNVHISANRKLFVRVVKLHFSTMRYSIDIAYISMTELSLCDLNVSPTDRERLHLRPALPVR